MKQNDHLNGGDGDDFLAGGFDKDILMGGAGDDMFEFNSIKDAKKGDVIKDFSTGSDIDLIDLEGIDARMGGADNAFKFIGTHAFHHKAGVLHYVKSHGSAIVEGDVNGDGRADFHIQVNHVHALTADDFIL
jgi:Ca2+-binding RTX toxin-like protein